jgi:hypothetical protein
MAKHTYDCSQLCKMKLLLFIFVISILIPGFSQADEVPVGIGTNITVTPMPGVFITFSNVVTGGTLSVSLVNNPAPPADFRVGSLLYYDMYFSGALGGPVNICLTYDQSLVGGNEKNIKLLQLVNLEWLDIMNSLDIVDNEICGVTTFLDGALLATYRTTGVGYSPLWQGMTLVSLMLTGGYMLRRKKKV